MYRRKLVEGRVFEVTLSRAIHVESYLSSPPLDFPILFCIFGSVEIKTV